ncbi:MAG: DUF4349 domain-containing protein [Chloroflexi bacterium]|nr:DUF4349 domain-containing protein [Chloroflexota bacterium]
MKRTPLALVLIAALTLAACAGAAATREAAPMPYISGEVSSDNAAPGYAEAPAATAAPALAPGQSDGQQAGLRLVIKNANLSIVVDSPAAAVEAITQMAEGMGGFVVSLNTYQTTYGPDSTPAEQANMTVRVPAARLNDALSQIKALAVEVKSKSIVGQDVTAEYTDLQSRLANLEAAEKQLQSIMAEATKTEDVLAVYNQLVYTREQIEVIKGQMKYYEDSAALSAITLDIIPNIVTKPIEIGGWHPEGTAKQAIEDLVRGLQTFTDGLIYFGIACLPFLLVIGLPLFFIGRALWRRRKKNAAPKAD